MSVTIDIKELLEAGAHFGHKTSRWHPKMAPFIHSTKGSTHIIDLVKTVEHIEVACAFLTKTTSSSKQVLIVGTKKQAQPVVQDLAEKTEMPFVTQRWLGGMLTNHKTITTRVKKLKMLEEKMESGELKAKYNKLEVQRFSEEIETLRNIYGGIKDMHGLPGAIIVFDSLEDHIAITEATKLGIDVVAIVDTNADPTKVKYPIASNDDAIKTLTLLADYFEAAIKEGKELAKKSETKKEEKNEEKAGE